MDLSHENKHFLLVAEISAIIAGKYTKIQRLLLPGNVSKSIKIQAVSVCLVFQPTYYNRL